VGTDKKEMSEALWQAHLKNNSIAKVLIQAQAKKLVKWLDSQCENHPLMIHPVKKKIACRLCWEQLRRQVGLE